MRRQRWSGRAGRPCPAVTAMVPGRLLMTENEVIPDAPPRTRLPMADQLWPASLDSTTWPSAFIPNSKTWPFTNTFWTVPCVGLLMPMMPPSSGAMDWPGWCSGAGAPRTGRCPGAGQPRARPETAVRVGPRFAGA